MLIAPEQEADNGVWRRRMNLAWQDLTVANPASTAQEGRRRSWVIAQNSLSPEDE